MATPSPAAVPTVGILGAGQLARMTYQAAIPLGLRVRLLAERHDDAAALVARDVSIGSPRSAADLAAFAAGCAVLTCDHELVDAQALAELERGPVAVRPGAAVVALVQDKARQRATLAALGFPVPPHRPVERPHDLDAFGEEHGWPVVAKARRGGYDGRGVWVLAGEADAARLWDEAAERGVALLAEAWVPLEREVAVLVARRPSGEAVAYPPVETVQRDGICRELLAPATLPPALAAEAERLGLAVAEGIGVVGILAVELFVAGERLVVNELAARPHNAGHHTIEGSATSQFAQHLRAVLDWPLGETRPTAPAVATVNLLGGPDGADPLARVPHALAVPGVHVHLYGKAARPGRKLGHVTALGDRLDEARARAAAAAARLGAAPVGAST
jgi:5-(carboxyamino)imidazole ribonucleotide synthase